MKQLLLIILLITVSVNAKIFWLDGNSATNGNGLRNNPINSFQDAVDSMNANPGSVCYIIGDTYDIGPTAGTVTFSASGKYYGQGEVIIDHETAGTNFTVGNAPVIEFRNMVITQSTLDGTEYLVHIDNFSTTKATFKKVLFLNTASNSTGPDYALNVGNIQEINVIHCAFVGVNNAIRIHTTYDLAGKIHKNTFLSISGRAIETYAMLQIGQNLSTKGNIFAKIYGGAGVAINYRVGNRDYNVFEESSSVFLPVDNGGSIGPNSLVLGSGETLGIQKDPGTHTARDAANWNPYLRDNSPAIKFVNGEDAGAFTFTRMHGAKSYFK